MALNNKRIEKALQTISSTIAAIANNAYSSAIGVYDNSADGYPLADLIYEPNYTVAPAADKTIDVYQQDIDVDGTNDGPVPDSTYKRKFIGSFYPDAVTGAQYLVIRGILLPPKSDYVLHNNATGQTIPINSALKIQPYGHGS